MRKKIFVSGATGFTGKAVVKELTQHHDVDVIAHVRPDSSRLEHWKQHFGALGATVDTTAWEISSMTETMKQQKPDVVFALLGTTKKRGREAKRQGQTDTYQTVDIDLTVMLVDALKKNDSTARFVYLSSVGVTPNTSNAYLKARATVEAYLHQHYDAAGYTIARPSIIAGERDNARPLENASAVVADGFLGLVGLFGGKKLQRRYQSTSDTRLAQALIRLAFSEEAKNKVFESEQLTP